MVNTLDCLVTYPEHTERVTRIKEQVFKSEGGKPTIKVTAFNQNSQDAFLDDPRTEVEERPVHMAIRLTKA